MKIKKIEIKNVLGIKEFEFSPGEVNLIKGRNSVGKTSLVEAIKSSLQGGNDATLIHNGSDEAETVIIFDNDYQLRRRVRNGKPAITDFKDENGHNIPSPQTELNALFDAISVNPIEFINKKGKDRLESLLEILPVDISFDEVKEKINNSELVQDKGLSGIHLLDNVNAQLFDERTGVNRLVKDKQSHIVELDKDLDVFSEYKETVDKDELQKEYDKIRDEATDKKTELIQQNNNRLNSLKKSENEEIEEIREKYRRIYEGNEKKHKEMMEDLKNEFNEKTSDLKRKIDEAEEHNKKANRYEQIREALVKTQKELISKKAEAESLTFDLDTLKTIKSDLIKNVPIPGFNIEDGEIYVDEVPFDRLNTAKQIQIAVDVAKLRMENSNIKVMCVDGLERFDLENLELFEKEIKKTGIQCFVTRVTESEELEMEVV